MHIQGKNGLILDEKRKQLYEALKRNQSSQEIIKSKEQEFPLSSAQRRLWLISKIHQDSSAYNESFTITIEKDFLDEFVESIKFVVSRHDVLRTILIESGDTPRQKVNDEILIPMNHEYINAEDAPSILVNLANIPFNFQNELLYRITFIHTNDSGVLVLFVFHHMICDGWSNQLLFKELQSVYYSKLNNTSAKLTTIPLQYGDYCVQEQSLTKRAIRIKDMVFWRNYLKDFTEFPLHNIHKKSVSLSNRAGHYTFQISQDLKNKIEDVVRHNKVTVFAALVSNFILLLKRYAGEKDIVIGTTLANRDNASYMSLLGYFSNMLPLRILVDENDSTYDLQKKAMQNLLELFQRQDTPFELIVEEINPDRDVNKNPIFQVMFNYLKVDSSGNALFSNELNIHKIPNDFSKMDLLFDVTEYMNNIQFNIEFNSNLFSQEMIEQIAMHYLQLLNNSIKEPKKNVNTVAFLTDHEYVQLISSYNESNYTLPKNLTIIDLFKQQATRVPNKVAVVFENKEMTYGELYDLSERLSHNINRMKLNQNVSIGIYMNRSIDMVVTILGVLKSGASYIPLDPNFPKERLEDIINGSQIELIFVDEKTYNFEFKHLQQVNTLYLNDYLINYTYDTVNYPKEDDIAYVIYTSGSTGKPKGVKVTHSNLLNAFIGFNNKLQPKDGDVILAATTISFDISILELLWPMTKGLKVVLLGDKVVSLGNANQQVLNCSLLTKRYSNHSVPNIVSLNHNHNISYASITKQLEDPKEMNIWHIKSIPQNNNEIVNDTIKVNYDMSSYINAAKNGFNIVTDLFFQDINNLQSNISIYYKTLREHGYKPSEKKVSLYLHVFIDQESSMSLIEDHLKEIYRQTQDGSAHISDSILMQWVNQYFSERTIVEAEDKSIKFIANLQKVGVSEIVFIYDYGQTDAVKEQTIKYINVLCDKYKLEHDYSFESMFLNHKVTIFQTTPTMLQMLINQQSLNYLKGLRILLVGGEVLNNKLLTEISNTLVTTNVYNMYGPTETTIWSTIKELEVSNTVYPLGIPLGSPIINTEIYILDEYLNPQPYDIPGEIYISGKGVSKGYLNQSVLTNERFIRNPFHEGQLYKTGDYAYRTRNGEILFIGRKDNQIKIRGYRIELGEIEAKIENHPFIIRSVVICDYDKSNDAELIAYYISTNEIDEDELHQLLSHKLPEYSIPKWFVRLEEFPMTPNKKIDKKQLLNYKPITKEVTYYTDYSDTEIALINIWKEVLNNKSIDLESNFFKLRGQSLTATRLIAKIRETFQVDIPLKYIFNYPTVRQLAREILMIKLQSVHHSIVDDYLREEQ